MTDEIISRVDSLIDSLVVFGHSMQTDVFFKTIGQLEWLKAYLRDLSHGR